jgi:hypothetical protein
MNDLRLIAKNKKYNYYIYNIRLGDEKLNMIDTKEQVHGIYDKIKKKLNLYFIDFQNKFKKLNSFEVKEENIESELHKQYPELKKSITKSILSSIFVSTAGFAGATDIKFFQNKDTIYTQFDNNTILGKEIIGTVKEVYKINETMIYPKINPNETSKMQDTKIVINFGNTSNNSELDKLTKKLGFNEEASSKIKSEIRPQMTTGFSMVKAMTDNKGLIYLNIDKEMGDIALKEPSEMIQLKILIKNILIHEFIHNKYNGNELDATNYQIFGEKLDPNSKIATMFANSMKQEEINTTVFIAEKLKQNFENEKYNEMNNVIIRDKIKKLEELEKEELSIESKELLLSRMQPDRCDFTKKRIAEGEYIQSLSPIEEFDKYKLVFEGGYIYNIVSILKENNYSSEDIYNYISVMSENEWIEEVYAGKIQNNINGLKQTNPDLYKQFIKQKEIAIVNSILIFDNSQETKTYLQRSINNRYESQGMNFDIDLTNSYGKTAMSTKVFTTKISSLKGFTSKNSGETYSTKIETNNSYELGN